MLWEVIIEEGIELVVSELVNGVRVVGIVGFVMVCVVVLEVVCIIMLWVLGDVLGCDLLWSYEGVMLLGSDVFL